MSVHPASRMHKRSITYFEPVHQCTPKSSEVNIFGNDSKDRKRLSLCSPRRHVRGVEVQPHSFGSRWSWVVSIMPRPFYPRERSQGKYLISKVDGPESQSKFFGGETNLFCTSKNEYINSPPPKTNKVNIFGNDSKDKIFCPSSRQEGT